METSVKDFNLHYSIRPAVKKALTLVTAFLFGIGVMLAQPTVNFSFNGTCLGDNTAFTDATTGGIAPYTYSWDFGDSATSTSQSPSHVYASPGLYSVTLLVTDNLSLSDSLTLSVGINSGPSASISSSTNASCGGSCDGNATASATGGTPPYAYLWDDSLGQVSATAAGLCAGTYTATITDSLGCIGSASITITEPPLLAASASSINATCNGACDGVASAVASGGLAPYTYAWDSLSGSQTTATAIGLCAGTYSVIITDANGCTASTGATISEPPLLGISASSTNATCNGACDGTASVIASGGTVPYTYLWDDPSLQTTATATGLCAGTFSVVITDASGCTNSASVTITDPTLIVASASSSNATCNGACDGTATVVASGGIAPYNYQWDSLTGSQITASISALCAGTYSVIITDVNGCTASASVTITDPTLIVASASSSNATCNGACDGTATIVASGGTVPYTYQWDSLTGSQTTASVSALCAGTYGVIITDSIGCTASASVTITEPILLAAAITSSTNLSCNGSNDGSAAVAATGGLPPYTYSWSPSGDVTATAAALAAGVHTATVTDANGCTASVAVTLTQPGALSAFIAGSTNISCNGASDGIAIVFAVGGAAPYNYSWSPSGSINDTAFALGAGVHTATVTDANGCTASDSAILIEPAALTANVSTITGISCNGAGDGSAVAAATGGTAPYNYSWTPSGSINDTVSALAAGTHTVSVTDANGCTVSDSAMITEPVALIASISGISNISCNGAVDGSAIAVTSGGTTPYTYLWSPSGSINDSASALAAGTHTVSVTDANGCSASDSVTIIEPAALTAAISASTNVSCNGAADGSAVVVATGGTAPYNYSWSPSGDIIDSPSALAAGAHTATVTDASGCTASATATITEPSALLATVVGTDATCANADGSAAATASGGTGVYMFLWDDPSNQTTPTAIGLLAGTYTATITDANNCSVAASTTIIANNVDAVISGTVSINGIPVTAGLVALLTYNTNPTMMTVAATTTIDNLGGYTFTGVVPDDYLLLAEADTSIYSNVVATFHDSTNHWQQGTVVTANCSDSIANIDVGLIDFPTNIAFGFISGRIQKGGPGKTGFVGVPFPGVDISLEEFPGGMVKGFTTTDDSGYYEFDNVEEGQYQLFVSIPGLDMDSTYTIDITVASGDTIFPDLNFHVDTTVGAGLIFVDTTVITGIADYLRTSSLFTVYPNPFTQFTTIAYSLAERGEVTMDLYNVFGQKIKTLYQGSKSAGDFTYRLSTADVGFSPGVYFVKLTFNGQVQEQRIIGLD